MKLYIEGLPSIYETEQLTRMFYKEVKLAEGGRHKEQDIILARAGKFRVFCALRTESGCLTEQAKRPKEDKELEFALCRTLFRLLCKATGTRPPWGVLTGVRPVRLVHRALEKGLSEEETLAKFENEYLCTKEKAQLALFTAKAQMPVIAALPKRSCSLYIGIPFCPTRCSYCSFVSRTIGSDKDLVAPYLDKLCLEIKEIARIIRRQKLHLCTIYIGGGTPTSLSAEGLRQLMGTVREEFDLSALEEYTVEAGRPDCTDFEKLCILKEYGASRISINPQTFSDEVLFAIGRKHTAEDVRRCFAEARKAGHANINMDLIAGLPKDTVEGFEKSLAEAIRLSPENITVHTLTLKRASSLVIDNAADEYEDVAHMVEKNAMLLQNGYRPYYLYRQKGTLQSLENTGFSKPGYEGLYNIYIMEELHTILSAGAGGVTKLKGKADQKIERVFNYKYPQEYITGFDAMLERKERIDSFYGSNLDPETTG